MKKSQRFRGEEKAKCAKKEKKYQSTVRNLLAMLQRDERHISEVGSKRFVEKVKKARDKQAKAERKLERERYKKDKLKKLGTGKALIEDDKALMSNHEVKR